MPVTVSERMRMVHAVDFAEREADEFALVAIVKMVSDELESRGRSIGEFLDFSHDVTYAELSSWMLSVCPADEIDELSIVQFVDRLLAQEMV